MSTHSHEQNGRTSSAQSGANRETERPRKREALNSALFYENGHIDVIANVGSNVLCITLPL